MIKIQKIIKYFGIGLALLLTVNIISMVMYGFISIGSIFSPSDNNITEELKSLDVNKLPESLDIDIASSNIIIKEATEFKIETNNNYIKIKEFGQKLYVSENNHNLTNNTNNSNLVIYLPTDYILDNISIENGAGKIKIESLNTQKLNLDLGAGKVDINNLTVSDSVEIDGGAGEITVTNGNINNLDLDMGVGQLTLSSIITGNSEIDAGIGTIDIDLIGTPDEYKIMLDKGIGAVTVDGKSMKDNTYYGNGSNLIELSGGIGNIKINFVNK